MATYSLSLRARDDIEHIWNYTLEHWGIDQAEIYIRSIKIAIEGVAESPHKGRAIDDVRTGYYKFHVGPHILFYRRTNSGIDVVRILHQRMDYIRHL